MHFPKKIPRKAKGLFWAPLTLFGLAFVSAPYQVSKGWSMVECIVNFWFPRANWSYDVGYEVEGYILGNLFVLFGIGFVITLILFFISYFRGEDEESAELKAIKELPQKIGEELDKRDKQSGEDD